MSLKYKITKIKWHSNEEDSTVYGLRGCRDTMNYSEHGDMSGFFFFVCVLVVCNSVHTATLCIGPCTYANMLGPGMLVTNVEAHHWERVGLGSNWATVRNNQVK